jgi:hypothetical protein
MMDIINVFLSLRHIMMIPPFKSTSEVHFLNTTTHVMFLPISVVLHLQSPFASVATGSKPEVSIEGQKEGGMALLCGTKGWFPEPELEWLDSEGVTLSAGPSETDRDYEGFYVVKLKTIVKETDINRFTCRVRQSQLHEVMETGLHIPSE